MFKLWHRHGVEYDQVIKEGPVYNAVSNKELESDAGRLMVLCFRKFGIRKGGKTKIGRWLNRIQVRMRMFLRKHLVNNFTLQSDESSWLLCDSTATCREQYHTVEHAAKYILIHRHDDVEYHEVLYFGMTVPIYEENWTKQELNNLHRRFRYGHILYRWPH